jgi:hypothetical protein
MNSQRVDEFFNFPLSHEIYKIRNNRSEQAFSFTRKLLSLPVDAHPKTSGNIVLPSHPLVGKTLIEKKTGFIYIIEQVNLQFYGGWAYHVLINHNGSHAFLHWENLSSICETILEGIAETQDRYQVVE